MIVSGIKNLIKNIFRYHEKSKKNIIWNELLDKEVIPAEEFSTINPLEFNCSSSQLENFLAKSSLTQDYHCGYIQKKHLEFFFSFSLLRPGPDDILLDAAGGNARFIDAAMNISNCKCYLNDHIYQNVEYKKNVTIIGGDISSINLPDRSVTRITCHHSFEHFHGDKDIKFILEIKRLLKHGGKAVIIPVFISSKYFETWSRPTKIKYDKTACTLIDKTASLPGDKSTGYFARIYDETAFKERILNTAFSCGLHPKLFNCLLDGKQTPDMDRNHGAKINRPMRALFLEYVR